jgi:hypothetical protein
VAEWRPGEGTEELLARADAALYHARRATRGASTPGEASSRAAEASAVTAHGLLNSSAVVSMGITTLQAHWDGMKSAEREHLLGRMFTHAAVRKASRR